MRTGRGSTRTALRRRALAPRLAIPRLLAVAALGAMATFTGADAQTGYGSQWSPAAPGIAYGLVGGLTRTGGSLTPYQDFTVAIQATARNDRNVDQWAFGVAAEAWAMAGSRSTLVGLEAAVVNEEPLNRQPKVAANLVFKNRPDGAEAPPFAMNANSIAMWVTAQPGTGFERGLAFAHGSLHDAKGRPAAIDLSDLTDEEVARVDLIRLRRDVSLRYDPAAQRLVVVVETPGL